MRFYFFPFEPRKQEICMSHRELIMEKKKEQFVAMALPNEGGRAGCLIRGGSKAPVSVLALGGPGFKGRQDNPGSFDLH